MWPEVVLPSVSRWAFGLRARRLSLAVSIAIPLTVLLLVSSPALAANTAVASPSAASSFSTASSIPLPPGGNFSTYLGNIERTSSSNTETLINLTTASSLHLDYSYDAGTVSVQSQPAVQNGVVYFGDNDGYEYAIYASNGTLIWKTFLGLASTDTGCPGVEGITSTATVMGSTLYVDGGYPYFYALNSATGAIEWRAQIGSGSNAEGFYDWSSPLIYDEHAYVGISSECDSPLVKAGLDEYSLITDKAVKYFDTSVPEKLGSSIWGSPSLNPVTNTLFVATGNAYGKTTSYYSESVLAFNATTLVLKAKWQVPAAQAIGDGDFGVTPTLFTPAGGYPMVTAPNKNGILYAFYQSNLTLAWKYRLCCSDVEDEHISTAWGGGNVYAVSSDTAIGGVNYNSSVRAFNPLTGKVVWAEGFTQTSYDGYAAPLYVNGLLVVADGHSLLVLNASSGAVLYSYNQPGHFVAAPSISRGQIFVGSSDGSVYVFGL